MNNSYWLNQTTAKSYPRLTEDKSTNIVIIGAGLTGLTTAYYLSSVTNHVIVVEADTVGYGASGRNTGKLSALHGLLYKQLEHMHGEELPYQYYSLQKEAIEAVAGIVNKHNIDCDFSACSSIVFTQDETKAAQLQDEYQCCLDHHIPVQYIDEVNAPFGIAGGLKMDHQAKYDPYRYLLGLAEVIQDAGIELYEHSPVQACLNKGTGYELKVNGHTIKAEHVVMATQAPIVDHMKAFFAKTYPEVSHIACVHTSKFTTNDTMINIDDPLQSYNLIKDQQLLCGGYQHPCGEMDQAHLEDWLNHLRKQWTCADIQDHWSSQDWMSHDNLPFIGPISEQEPHLYVACGYQAWGNTFSNIAAKLICADLLQEPSADAKWFTPSRMGVLFRPKTILKNLDTMRKLVKSKFTMPDTTAITPGHAKVIEIDGHAYGYYLNENLEEFLVDLTCPHMGCTLGFNDADHTWDCPCHGSRFSYRGELIKGPANQSLSTDQECHNHIDPHILKDQ